jgi:antitoxin CptB
MTETDEARLKKLKFRAWRRGFREADLILGPFADKHVASLTPAELTWFEALLEVPDHDIYGWIMGSLATPPEYDTEIMNQLKAFKYQVHAVRGDGHGG